MWLVLKSMLGNVNMDWTWLWDQLTDFVTYGLLSGGFVALVILMAQKLRKKKRPPLCNVCGQLSSDVCTDCQDELGIKIYFCSLDKCRAEHVAVFHRRLTLEHFHGSTC